MKKTRPKVNVAGKREKTELALTSEREQARPKVKSMVSAMWSGAAPGDADRTGALYIWTFS